MMGGQLAEPSTGNRRPTMPAKRKTIELTVTLSVPAWLTKAQAAREVRALINDQAFYGTRKRGTWDEIDDSNFRARSVK
jgi:hypothetical protein